MESQQHVNIIRIFHLEKELLDYLKKEEKEELSSLKRPRNKVVSILKSAFSVFRNPESEDPKRGKEEVIEELLTYFKALKESGNKDLLMEYLNFLDEEQLKKLYGIELNKYNLEKIETYYTTIDSNIFFTIQTPVISYMSIISYKPTEENINVADKLISDIIVVLEKLKGNEPNKNKIN